MKNKEMIEKTMKFFKTIGNNDIIKAPITDVNVDFIVIAEDKSKFKVAVYDMENDSSVYPQDYLKLETHDEAGCLSWWFWDDVDVYVFHCGDRVYAFEKKQLQATIESLLEDGYAFKVEIDVDWTSRKKSYIVPVEKVFNKACMFFFTHGWQEN